LASVGLSTEVRTGENCSLLIFVRIASEAHLNAEVYRSRVQDWLYGVRTSAPDKEVQKSIKDEPVTEAERLRLVYLLITKPKSEGGASIAAKSGEWENVESIFAPHDPVFNKAWIKTWGAKYFLNIRDLTVIRDRFGEKIAFYFAFLQSYFMFLIFPAAFGFSCWVLLDLYSPVYAVVSCLWCGTFVEYWKKQEVDLATQWGVRGISKIQHKRPEFRYETEVIDPITGEKIKSYSPFKRLARQALQIPFAIIATLLLGGLIVMCFSIEIFISEVYDGPFKTYLVR
jgi:anoctamin-10